MGKRRACRTSENERPPLDGQYDPDIDVRPSLSPVLTRLRNRSSRCENILEKLPQPSLDVCTFKQSRPQYSDCIESKTFVSVPTPVSETPQEEVECDVNSTTHIASESVTSTGINELPFHNDHQPETRVKRRPKLIRLPTVDRFILPRKPVEHIRDLMHLGKKASELTPRQRMLRDANESNPFRPSIRVRNRSLEYARVQRTQRQLRAQSRQHSQILSQRHDTIENAMAGNSTVWDANGSISSIRAAARAPTSVVDTPESIELPRSFTSQFLYGSAPADAQEVHEERLALAMDVNRQSRLFDMRPPAVLSTVQSPEIPKWKDNTWFHDRMYTPRKSQNIARQAVPSLPFRVLEAPGLRDDFYCSALAYSPTINCLAVALGVKPYLWSESRGVILPPRQIELGRTRMSYISSLAFSSAQGGRAILAIGRGDGQISMFSHLDTQQRFLYMSAPTSVTHLSFCPKTVKRPSQRHPNIVVPNEVLLVGDDAGLVSVYFVEWPNEQERWMYGFHAAVTLHARIAVHTQQICGIAWSSDGSLFATGGNDNLCCIYSMQGLLNLERRTPDTMCTTRHMTENTVVVDVSNAQVTDIMLSSEDAKHIWNLNAAVKAIAFCPWQPGLIAAGGGSNDRCIHFFHTVSGTKLAKIDCGAQITSLVWSTTRREIAATFGFAQPEHPYRVAVYSWPDCHQVVALPWNPDLRALYAIPYPGGPQRRSTGGSLWPRRDDEGCLAIAASDGSIKFHEIWSGARRTVRPMRGLLGGSDILESLHGFDKDGRDTIR